MSSSRYAFVLVGELSSCLAQDNIIREHLTEWNHKMAEAKNGLEMRQLVWCAAL